MHSTLNHKQKFNAIIKRTGILVSDKGFMKDGNRFIRISNDLAQIIEFQPERFNTIYRYSFKINIIIFEGYFQSPKTKFKEIINSGLPCFQEDSGKIIGDNINSFEIIPEDVLVNENVFYLLNEIISDFLDKYNSFELLMPVLREKGDKYNFFLACILGKRKRYDESKELFEKSLGNKEMIKKFAWNSYGIKIFN
jgi:hypothetical protein